MEIQEFERLLHIGLGRAILFAHKNDLAPYRDLILHACLCNTAYDPQCEGSRAAYMFDIIRLTDQEHFYREQILRALARSKLSDNWNEHQLFDFARLFAQNGDTAARQLIYDTFVRNAAADNSTGAEHLIELDGIEGLLFVADQIGEQLMVGGDIDEADYLLDIVKERYGEERTLTALNEASAASPGIAAYIQRMAENTARRAKSVKQRSSYQNISYDEIKRQIIEKADKVPRLRLFRWGKSASDEDIERAATDLILEEDRLHLLAYLRLFQKRRFPREHSRLIALALDPDDDVAWWALAALKWIDHSDVRALAIRLLERGERRAGAVGLLINNYRDGDYTLIGTAINTEQDEDELHALGGRLLDVVNTHPHRNAASALIAMYEQGACSECREDFVDCLLSLDALPDWLRNECRYDANLNLRKKFAPPAS